MKRFNFKKFKNPIESAYTSTPKDNNGVVMEPITFTLKPITTEFAFDGSRWANMVNAGRADDALELQFGIGANRICGWTGVQDEDGKEVDFAANFKTFLAMVDSIPYIMDVGEKTLFEMDVLKEKTPESGNGMGVPQGQMAVEASVIHGEPAPEPSEANSETH